MTDKAIVGFGVGQGAKNELAVAIGHSESSSLPIPQQFLSFGRTYPIGYGTSLFGNDTEKETRLTKSFSK